MGPKTFHFEADTEGLGNGRTGETVGERLEGT